MGSVSLTERFLKPGALSEKDYLPMLEHIKRELDSLESFFNEDYDNLIFVAGTPTTLAFMEKKTSDLNAVHGLKLNENPVEFWLEKLSSLPVKERKKIPHLPEHRADVIVAGLSLLREILKKTGQKEFIVSATGVRYGLILEQLKEIT